MIKSTLRRGSDVDEHVKLFPTQKPEFRIPLRGWRLSWRRETMEEGQKAIPRILISIRLQN